MFSLRPPIRPFPRPLRLSPFAISHSVSLSTRNPSPPAASRLAQRRNELLQDGDYDDKPDPDVEASTNEVLQRAPRIANHSDTFSGLFNCGPASYFLVFSLRSHPVDSRRVTLHGLRTRSAIPAVYSFPIFSSVHTSLYCVLFQFIKPSDFMDRGDEDPIPRTKRSLVGPSAADSRYMDAFYQLGIDPLYEATNSILLSSFVTEMGKVKGRAETKLTWHSQRRLTRAIRRAKMMGIMPTLYKAENSNWIP